MALKSKPHSAFGKLLTQGIKRLVSIRHESMEMVQTEVAHNLGFSVSTLYTWRRGEHLPSPYVVAGLARIFVDGWQADQTWIDDFLKRGDYGPVHAAKSLQDELFNDSTLKIGHTLVDQKVDTPADKKPPIYFIHQASRQIQEVAPLALHQLRQPVGDFVGRSDEISRLVQTLSRDISDNGTTAAISGIRGMGGIGKTELAYKVANELVPVFRDAQLVLNLRGSTNTPLSTVEMLQTIIRAFEPTARLSDDATQLRSVYRSMLHNKRVLILADDAYDADQMLALMPPLGSALLITSRRHFRLPGMVAFNLETLPVVEAQQLLLNICPRIGNAASHLVTLCGRLPLALRISATLLENDSTYNVADYIKMLEDEHDRLNNLWDPDNPVLDVEASLKLSYGQLDEIAQSVLAQLSVFAGNFDEAAVEAIVELPPTTGTDKVKPTLSLLYRRSLLNYDHSQKRYYLHNLIRDFAKSRLGNDRYSVQLRHASYYARLVTQARKLYREGGEYVLSGLKLFDQERSQIDTAWNWLHHQTETHNDAVDNLLLAYANSTAYIGVFRYDLKNRQIPQLEAALKAAQRLERKSNEGYILYHLGVAYINLGYIHQAIEYFKQSLIVCRMINDQSRESIVLGNLGTAYRLLGEMQQAIGCYKQQLTIGRNINNTLAEVYALGGLGAAYRLLGNVDLALEYFSQQLILDRQIGNRRGEAFPLAGLGSCYLHLGDIERAISYFEQHRVICIELGDRYNEGYSYGNLGVAYYTLDDFNRAFEYYQEQLIVTQEVGDQRGQTIACWNMGLTLLRQDRSDEAFELMQKCIDIEQRFNHSDAEKHEQCLRYLQIYFDEDVMNIEVKDCFTPILAEMS